MAKRFVFVFLSCFLLSFALASFVSASDSQDSSAANEPVSTSEYTPTYIPDQPQVAESISLQAASPITPSNTNGLKKILVQLFGNYETIVSEYRYSNSNGYTSISIDQSPDYVWMISAATFLLILYCIFRFLGGVFLGRK